MDHPEKSKRQPSQYSKKWGLIIGLSVIMVCVSLYAFRYLTRDNANVICFGTLFPSYADIERQAVFKLPASAHNIDYDASKYAYGMGCDFSVKFEIAPEDFEVIRDMPHIINAPTPLIRRFEAKPTLLKNDTFRYIQQKWRELQSVDSIVGYSSELSIPHFGQHILIDTTNPNNFVVYILSWNQYA